MTIKKIALSAVATAMLTSTAFAAYTDGELRFNGAVNSLITATEIGLISGVDTNVSDVNMTMSGMAASSATEPNVELRFFDTNGGAPAAGSIVINTTATDLNVTEADTNISVATFSHIDDAEGAIIFNAVPGTQINRNTSYFLTDSNLSMTDLQDTNITLDGTITDARFNVYSNSGDTTPLVQGDLTIKEEQVQFNNCEITRPLNGMFTASSEFMEFSTPSDEANATSDTMTFTLNNNAIGNSWAQEISGANSIEVTLTTTSDVNLTDLVDRYSSAGVWTINDTNMTGLFDANNFDANGELEATVFELDGNVSQNTQVDFIANMKYLDPNDGLYKNLLADTLCMNNTDNVWGIYGYTAQIPGASATNTVDGTTTATETIVTIVNTSTNINPVTSMTIVDGAGNECALSSTTHTSVPVAAPGANNKYYLSEMVTECGNLTGSAFGIEPNVAMDPADVYSNAFVRNSNIDQFKVLPVYHNKSILKQ